jgi:hypothetical protein
MNLAKCQQRPARRQASAAVTGRSYSNLASRQSAKLIGEPSPGARLGPD